MRCIFFGDGLWATKCLEGLLDEGHDIAAVVLRRQPSDDTLEALARAAKIGISRPPSASDDTFRAWVRSLGVDLGISMSYNQILLRALLDVPRKGFINCHAGRLPHYRGRNVINWALLNGETEIGVTIHYMDEDIDTGDIILQATLPIEWEDTYETVLARVRAAFPDLLARAVRAIERGEAARQPQIGPGTYFGGRLPDDEWIDWTDSSRNIYNKIRAITRPGPGARSIVRGRTMIVWAARYDPAWPRYLAIPGQVVGREPEGYVRVKTGDSTIVLERIQFEGDGQPEECPQFPIGTRLGGKGAATAQSLAREVEALRVEVARLSALADRVLGNPA